MTLVEGARGQGLGLEVLELMCRYGFRVRDLYRLGLETLATNEAMSRTALKAGFVREGVLREAAYVQGERVDEVQYGVLRPEWEAAQRR